MVIMVTSSGLRLLVMAWWLVMLYRSLNCENFYKTYQVKHISSHYLLLLLNNISVLINILNRNLLVLLVLLRVVIWRCSMSLISGRGWLILLLISRGMFLENWKSQKTTRKLNLTIDKINRETLRFFFANAEDKNTYIMLWWDTRSHSLTSSSWNNCQKYANNKNFHDDLFHFYFLFKLHEFYKLFLEYFRIDTSSLNYWQLSIGCSFNNISARLFFSSSTVDF